MKILSLSQRRQAKQLIEEGLTSEEVGQLLDVRPGTVREWKRRYEWDSPNGPQWNLDSDIPADNVPEEYYNLMSTDILETLKRIRKMPVPRQIDGILKRERALELLTKRAERTVNTAPKHTMIQQTTLHITPVTEILDSLKMAETCDAM